jgi:replication factor A2
MWVGWAWLQIRVVGTVSGKAERATDVSFTLDDGTGRIDFIRW